MNARKKPLDLSSLNIPRFVIGNPPEIIGIRSAIIAEAKSIVGTPYVHQGRIKGVGTDCVGTILIVARALKLSDFEIRGYGRRSEGVEMFEEMVSQCGAPISNPLPGDIMMFAEKDWRHCGIISVLNGEISVIHTHSAVRKCVEHRLDEYWLDRAFACFKFFGIKE